MYDSSKVIPGIIIFLVLMTSPFWMNLGTPGAVPQLEKPVGETQCVEDIGWMKANHMQLLDNWRSEVVRDGERIYTNHEGKEFRKSLTLTCLDCHKDTSKFCDRCHVYASSRPYCWTCHVDPKGRL